MPSSKNCQNLYTPNLTIPDSYTQLSAFLLTLVDTRQQLGFNYDIHFTTNVNQALNKLPTSVRLERNKHVLERSLLQPPLRELSEWLLIYAKVCRDLPTSCASAQPPRTHSKASNFGSNRISKTNSIVRPTDHTRINAQTRQIGFNQDLRKVSFVQTTVAVSIYSIFLISKICLHSVDENTWKVWN